MTEKERKKIIKLGKANDALNKYSIKVAAVPFIAGTVLILLYGFIEETAVMLLGMGLLLVGCLIPIIWLIVLNIWAGSCKMYSYDLYQQLVREDRPESKRLPQKPMPLTQKIADEQFDGDIQQAVIHILHTYANEELNVYIHEWGPEESRLALNHMWESAQEKLGEKGIKDCLKNAVLLEELEMTEEDVLSAPNPFKKKIWKQLGVLAAACVGVPVVLGLFTDWFSTAETVCQWVLLGLSVFITFQATTIGAFIIKSVKFARLKKRLLKENVKE